MDLGGSSLEVSFVPDDSTPAGAGDSQGTLNGKPSSFAPDDSTHAGADDSIANLKNLYLMTQLTLVLVTHKVDSTANPKALYLMTQLMLVLVTHKVNSTANPKAWTLLSAATALEAGIMFADCLRNLLLFTYSLSLLLITLITGRAQQASVLCVRT